jgi:hypothetical protein
MRAMLQPITAFSQDIQLKNIFRGYIALCPETGAYMWRSRGRTSQAPKYGFICPKVWSGDFFTYPEWDNEDRKFVRAWTDAEAIELANEKLARILAGRKSIQAVAN